MLYFILQCVANANSRIVNPAQSQKHLDIFKIAQDSLRPPPPSLNSIPLSKFGTPVSLQTPKNACSFILPPQVYERSVVLAESIASSQEPVLQNLQTYEIQGSILELVIPCDKLQKCQFPRYLKLSWSAEVEFVMENGVGVRASVKVEDSSVRIFREPLLLIESRRKHIKTLMQERKIDEWIDGNEAKKYLCLRLEIPEQFTDQEKQPETINIQFSPDYLGAACITQCTESIRRCLKFRNIENPLFDCQKALVIEEIFLGYRLGRLLPDEVVERTKLSPSRFLFAEQAKVFSHVLNHDFTLVDGAPGTGKSRVTTDIVAGFILQGMRVLVMTTSEAALDSLMLSVLNALPLDDVRTSEMVARLLPPGQRRRVLHGDKETALESVSVSTVKVAYRGYHPRLDEARKRLDKATALFMTTRTVEELHPFYGIYRRVFDLIVLDDANAVSESLALRLTQLPFANAFRWLVIGCSKGIAPRVNFNEFKEMEICGSWFKRLLRHPEFRLNPLRLTKQGRSRKALYEPINKIYFNNTITMTSDVPSEEGDHQLCMGFVNSSRLCKAKKAKPESHDEELLEMAYYRKEQSAVFIIIQKIHKLTPHASIVILCYCESQRTLMAAELQKMRKPGLENSLSKAIIFVETIDDFANKDANYAIVHVPLWKSTYEYSADPGRLVIAMTRARKGVFAVGNLKALAEYENKRGSWTTNPWRSWLEEVKKSNHGAVFDDVAEIDLAILHGALATFKKGRAEMRPWLGERYTKEERVKLRGYW